MGLHIHAHTVLEHICIPMYVHAFVNFYNTSTAYACKIILTYLYTYSHTRNMPLSKNCYQKELAI